MSILDDLNEIVSINPITEVERMISTKEGFVGVPIGLNFEYVNIMINDFYKEKVKGIPQNCFLICVRPNSDGQVEEFILLRVLEPINLPREDDLLSSKVEYFKEFIPNGETDLAEKLDAFTRNEFQYSGLKCRVLGTYYSKAESNGNLSICFGADVETFYSSHNYLVYKPTLKLLTYIINFSEGKTIIGGKDSSRIGILRYSATRKQDWIEEAPVYIKTDDLLGKRTALFGMTRTGKSNTVKKIIESTVQLAQQENRKFGQLIFDINGEYANVNKQDEGTAIAKKYKDIVKLYSLIDKEEQGFIPMRANFYRNPEFAFNIILPFIEDENSDYVKNFKAIDLSKPEDPYGSAATRYWRKVAVFKCCLQRAGFKPSNNEKVKFEILKDILDEVKARSKQDGLDIDYIEPSHGISLDHASLLFETLWKYYLKLGSIQKYKSENGKEWADDDLKTLLRMLTTYKEGNTGTSISGYKKLNRKELHALHTSLANALFEDDILQSLRNGEIVIVDLSEGEEIIRRTYSEKIVTRIFKESMQRFINNQDEADGFNIIQIYFEEAHNLFPKRDNSDLSDIYNRLAKEGAKYKLGINYATQEVSSISSNILKNTQNWFIAHLNNTEETREINKYYDFKDFENSILKVKDKGFLRIKTYSNHYVIPVQVDKFVVGE